MILSRPDQFNILTSVSVAMVALSSLIYFSFLIDSELNQSVGSFERLSSRDEDIALKLMDQSDSQSDNSHNGTDSDREDRLSQESIDITGM